MDKEILREAAIKQIKAATNGFVVVVNVKGQLHTACFWPINDTRNATKALLAVVDELIRQEELSLAELEGQLTKQQIAYNSKLN